MPDPRHRGRCQHYDAYQRSCPAVADLDHGREVERREPSTVTEWPVIATAHAGAGNANDTPEHDETACQGRSGACQPAKQLALVSIAWVHEWGLWAMGCSLFAIRDWQN